MTRIDGVAQVYGYATVMLECAERAAEFWLYQWFRFWTQYYKCPDEIASGGGE